MMAGTLSATTAVTGNLTNLGTGTANGFVRFWLRGCGGNQPRANNIAVIAPTQGGTYYFDIPAVGGVVSGTLYSTRAADGVAAGELSCGGSFNIWYGMQISTAGKFGPEVPVAAKNNSTLDVTTVTPLNVTPVVTAPDGDSTYVRLDSGNNPITGTPEFNLNADFLENSAPAAPVAPYGRLWLDSTTHKLSCKTSTGANCIPSTGSGGGSGVTPGTTLQLPKYTDGPNGVVGDSAISDDGTNVRISENFIPGITDSVRLYANSTACAGADAAAKIQACINLLPATGGIVDAWGLTDSGGTGSVTIDPGTKAVTLLLGPTTYNVSQIRLRSSFHIYGSGSGGLSQQTILKSSASTTDMFVLGGTSPASGVILDGFRAYGASGSSGATNQSFLGIVAQTNGGGLWSSTIRDLNVLGFCGSGGTHGIIRLDGTAGGSPPAINQFNTFSHVESYRPVNCGPVVEMAGFNGQIRFSDSHLDSNSGVTTGTNVTIADTSASLFPFNIYFDNVTIQGGAIGVNAAGCNMCSFNQMHHEAETGAYLVPASSGANANLQITNSQFNSNVGTGGYIVNVVASATNASVYFAGNNFGSPTAVFSGNTAAITSIGNTGGTTVSGTDWYASNTLTGGLFAPVNSTVLVNGTLDASTATTWRGRLTAQANPNSPLITCLAGETIFSLGSTNGQNNWNCNPANTWTQNSNSGAGGMSTAASNAAAVAVPVDWSPSGTGAQSLGAAAHPWGNLFFGAAATNNFKLTGAATGARIITAPDATFTLGGLELTQAWTGNNTFTKIVSASPNATTTGCFLCLGTGDVFRYWNSGLSSYLNLIGDGGIGPVPVGDTPGISVGGAITSQAAGASMTIQPIASTGNNNGGDLTLASGRETGAGHVGDIILDAGNDGVIQHLTGDGFPVVNNPTTLHPVINNLASSSGGQAIITPKGSLANLLGVCIRNCTLSGSGIFVRNGKANLNLDNSGTAGDPVFISQSTDGFGTDLPFGSAATSQYVGRVIANVSGTLYQVDVCMGCESFASAAAGAVALGPAANQTIQGTSAAVISLITKCPAGAASTLGCFQVIDNTGANVFKPQQSGQIQIGTGVGGSMQLTDILGPNATPAAAGLIRNSDTDIALAWRNHANTGDVAFSKDTNDVVTLSGIFRATQGQFTLGAIDLTEFTAPAAIAGHDICYADSTAHAIKCSLNNGSFLTNAFLTGDLGGTAAAAIVSKIDGTTVPVNSAADQTLVTTASATGAWKSLPLCGDASHGLSYDTATHTFGCQSITGTAGNVADPGGNGVMVRTALNTTINRTLQSGSGITVTNGTGVSADPSFALDTTVAATLSNTMTFTNKTVDAEGTGNVYTRPFYVSYTPGCNNATASQGSFNVPTSGAATFTCFGTTTTLGAADFVDGSTTTVLGSPFSLPQGWTGAMDVRIVWFGGTSSANAVRFSVSIGCVADTESINAGATQNTASASNTAYTGTANQRKTTVLTGISMTNCSAGESAFPLIQRIGADAGDTYAATAEVVEVQFEGRSTK